MRFLQSIVYRMRGWRRGCSSLLEKAISTASACVLFGMMLVTFIDVVGRDVFGSPLPGGFEVTELLLATVVLLGLPLVTGEGGHIDVDLLDSKIPHWLKPVQTLFINLFNCLAFGVLSWMLCRFAFRTYRYEDTTAILQIPYAWLVFLMAMTSTFAMVAVLMKLVGFEARSTQKGA